MGTLSLAEPLAASFLGVFVLHEHLTTTAALGSLLMLAGLAAACLPAPRARSTTPPSEPSVTSPDKPPPAAGQTSPAHPHPGPHPHPGRPAVPAAEPATADVRTGLSTR
ncbi:hypothetical protein QFZ76_009720 [Streptomyces sp. V4I2]|nr:hypothetical protein [Streptomyces sp. V4I2]